MSKYILVYSISALLACNAQNKQPANTDSIPVNTSAVAQAQTEKPVDYSIGPPTIIYKTKSDYYDKVPVILSDDKATIVSYPAPQDIYYDGKLALPVNLAGGYLLDNRGVTKSTAFLSVTYEEYSKLKAAPTLAEMMKMIIDKAPFTEMYNCGNRYQYKDVVNELNKAIDTKQLNKFKRIL